MESFNETIQTLQVALLWFDFAVIAGLSSYLFLNSKSWKAYNKPRFLLLGAIFTLALGLRLFLSPHTLLHENAHGYEYLRSAFTLDGFFFHGSTYYAFFHPITAVFGRQPETVFTVNAVISAATLLIFVPVSQLALGDDRPGWFAALLYACWPPILRIAGSESMFPLAIALGMGALWIWLSAMRTGSIVRFILSACLMCAAVQTRPVMIVWVVVVLGFSPLRENWRSVFSCRGPWVAFACFLLSISAWAVFRIGNVMDVGVPPMMQLGPKHLITSFFSGDNLLWSPQWVPSAVWSLSAVGIASSIRFHRRFLLIILLGTVLLGWFSIAPSAGVLVSQVRLQSPMHICLLFLAGLGANQCYKLVRQRWRFPLVMALLAVVSIELVGRVTAITHQYNPQTEYAFLEETTDGALSACTVITVDHFMANRVLATEFPTWWISDGAVYSLDGLEQSLDHICESTCLVWYHGLTCSLFSWQEVEQGLVPANNTRNECSAFEQDHELTEFASVHFDNEPYLEYLIPLGDRISVGFYELTARGRAKLCKGTN